MLCLFFFQAEDGIRAGHVTGVQTCALPISSFAPRLLDRGSGPAKHFHRSRLPDSLRGIAHGKTIGRIRTGHPPSHHDRRRSEERREGKSVGVGGAKSNKNTHEERKREQRTE